MRYSVKSFYSVIFSLLALAACNNDQLTRADRIVIITDSISARYLDLEANFYDSSFALQSVQLQSKGKIVFLNASRINEIWLRNPSGAVWEFIAMGGDSVRISFVDHTPAIEILNRKNREWDQHFEWLSRKELGNDSSALEDYYYLAETINNPFSGTSSEMLGAELDRLRYKAQRGLATRRKLLDSLVAEGKISISASQYLTAKINFKEQLLSEMVKGKLLFTDSSVRKNLNVFAASQNKLGMARSLVFQSFLDGYARRLTELNRDALSLYVSLSALSIDGIALNLLKTKVAALSYEHLSELDRTRFISLLNNDGLNQEAVRIAAMYPVADIFGKELILRNQKGESVFSDVLAIRHRGKKLYIDIWAGWCGPCISEIPALKELQSKHKLTTDIIYVSIDKSPEDWRRAIQKHFNANDEDHYYLDLDQQASIARMFGITSIPRYILLNESGGFIFSSAPRPHDVAIDSILQVLPNN